jgi:DDE superfamily endonuclease
VGSLQEGERKSIEPLSRRVSLPAELAPVADPEQALQQLVNQSRWDEAAVAREYRAAMAETLADPDGIFVVDDTTLPKAGQHSVGVQRQHCGALGKKANCQCAVSLHYVAPKGHCPLSMRLYLPPAWLEEPARLDRAGVPQEERRDLTKGQIALELLSPSARRRLAGPGGGGRFRLRGFGTLPPRTGGAGLAVCRGRHRANDRLCPRAAVGVARSSGAGPQRTPQSATAGEGFAATGHPGGVSRAHAIAARDVAQRHQRAL